MGYRVNPIWLEDKQNEYLKDKKLDVTTSFNPGIQVLAEWLAARNVMFKIYNLGAGIKRITTDTEICPCCKRKV